MALIFGTVVKPRAESWATRSSLRASSVEVLACTEEDGEEVEEVEELVEVEAEKLEVLEEMEESDDVQEMSFEAAAELLEVRCILCGGLETDADEEREELSLLLLEDVVVEGLLRFPVSEAVPSTRTDTELASWRSLPWVRSLAVVVCAR